ncbi:uracil-DNA glycosylase [Roseivivax halodurans JCM 10272]|uniref:Type-4 uracil-DNA glycosylase n=1 Tax=Roseivivax halodurans JCM 10272 TaxID=1449350 RepID=X7EFJ1_9RHOB|nr:uracil-DNA glycosylase [Roseivivax halodurans]ETX14844.1 uracil-DNA glycosylase [Roseivivax halodurans JCM 10272]
MDSALDWHTARALLDWQVEMGVTEAISEAPVNRFEAEAERAAQAVAAAAETAPQPGAAAPVPQEDPVGDAEAAAAAAQDLAALRAAIDAYPHCELRRGARNLVFCDGAPVARVMIVGEAPGREEDLEGRPFVGRAGKLLDRMLAAIGLARDAEGEDAVYITNVLPWRPPNNRDPRPEEIEMMLPFLKRHVALADPDILVIMGNISAQATLGKRGITRLRGHWTEAMDRPALPMFHPAYLLRNPGAKRDAWADLLSLKARLADPKGPQ